MCRPHRPIDRLSDDSKFRCNNLDWSAPLFEQIVGYYTRADHPRPASHKDLFGLTICRPSGYATFMMEEQGLVEPNIVFKRPGATTDCFEGLVKGTYDVVVLAAETAEGAIAKVGAKDKVAFHQNLSYVATMHAVIAKTNSSITPVTTSIRDSSSPPIKIRKMMQLMKAASCSAGTSQPRRRFMRASANKKAPQAPAAPAADGGKMPL